ncbi:uncharacterized protein [Lepeophtheirus salmonis]|uniref:uncharacterized protein isoform X2 n=1 Tax=Lepeophtheirus salmonis TaxID=72036 RepID=UPI001AE3CC08|nr:uncharacterized protein LOC121120819 isoform X2 [Lepeophtheirus salmonis]XP_040571650.1 uncharacterized protein LOC121120819 isoform X2 [Lepeophtheirus salmonis]
MFGAAAVRNKKRREQQAINALNAQRGPYIKPFGPRFDPNVYPYVKYKKALHDESIHFGAANASLASSGGRKDSKVSRIDDERRKKLEQLNDDGIYNANNNANVILYVGLGMIAIGLIITFVGLGEKGFQTLELKLIGPSLVGCGIFFALLRILFCTVPSCFNSCAGKCCCVALNKKELEKKKLLDKRLITSAGVESIPRSSLQESAKSRSTPLPPIITAQPSFVRSSYQPSSQKDDTGEEEAPLTSKKPRQGSSARRKTTTEAPRAFQLRSAERRKTAPSSTSSSSKGNRKSLDEFSITDSDLILQEEVSSQVKRKEDPEKGGGGGSPSTSLKNLSHELVLSADGL